MLFAIDSNSEIKDVPRARRPDYQLWRSRLTDAEYQAIIDHLHEQIEGTEVQTSSWMPGSNWAGTVFHPIYESACLGDVKAAAKFFGLIVWDAFIQHPEDWSFIRLEKDDGAVQGLTYFRIHKTRR